MGSRSVRAALLSEYARGLIRYKARQLSRKPTFNRSDEEDIEQDLTVHLLSQAHRFDPKRASANTFAARVVESAVKMMLRNRRRKKRAAGFSAQSIDCAGSRPPDDAGSLREVLSDADGRRRTGTTAGDPEQVERLAAVLDAYQSLPPELQDVCRRLIDSPAASIARELGISRRQVRNTIERIRSYFESTGLGDF